ncbi:hypothetical protein TNCV_2652891 [Trichonephila clavipes]|nr:hypothetical protein TNCV_2652891 [Trichonephila clavipes]
MVMYTMLAAWLEELFHCSIIGMLIISASVNKAADVAKEAVMSLPGKIPQNYNELKIILRKDLPSRLGESNRKSSREVGGRPLITPRCPPSKLGRIRAKSYCHAYGAHSYG